MPSDDKCVVDARTRATRASDDFGDLPGGGVQFESDEVPTLTSDEHFEALLVRTMGKLPLEVALVHDMRACRKALERGPSPDEHERLQAWRSQKLEELCALLRAPEK